MTSGKALLGVVAGIAAGVALGMIFAPEKGAYTRKNISKKGEELANALNEKMEEKFDELMSVVTGKTKTNKSKEPVNGTRAEMVG
jgi:gas vesicle protein